MNLVYLANRYHVRKYGEIMIKCLYLYSYSVPFCAELREILFYPNINNFLDISIEDFEYYKKYLKILGFSVSQWEAYYAALRDVDYYRKFIEDIDYYLALEDIYYRRQINSNSYQTLADVDYSVFSNTEIEALEFAFKHFGKFSSYDLIKILRSYPEYKPIEDGERLVNFDDWFKDPKHLAILKKDPFTTKDRKELINAKQKFKQLYKNNKE